MSRPLRIEYTGAHYHVMNRGLARTRIFLADEDRNRFLDLIGETCELWKVKIYAYCLMDNHYHLLLQTPQGNLSRVMRHLDGIYTQRFNRAHHRDGPLFRGRYRAIVIDAEEYFLAVLRYIHWNPTEAKLPSSTDGYRWSSHRGLLNRRQCPAWLEREEVLSRFGNGDKALEKFVQFINQGIEPELKQFYRDGYQRPILGDKDFVQRVKEKLGKRAQVSQEIPESRKTFGYRLEEIVRAVSVEYGVRTEELWKKRRGIENDARGMVIYLSRALGGHKLVDIGKLVGLENYSSVSSAYLSMRRRIEEDRRLAQRVDGVKRVLKGQKQT